VHVDRHLDNLAASAAMHRGQHASTYNYIAPEVLTAQPAGHTPAEPTCATTGSCNWQLPANPPPPQTLWHRSTHVTLGALMTAVAVRQGIDAIQRCHPTMRIMNRADLQGAGEVPQVGCTPTWITYSPTGLCCTYSAHWSSSGVVTQQLPAAVCRAQKHLMREHLIRHMYVPVQMHVADSCG
jgi:hypothetical protein